MIFHSQSVGFNVELAQLLEPELVWDVFPRDLDLGVCLWEFSSRSPSVSPGNDFG